MKWMRASKACQMKRNRVFPLDSDGSAYSELVYAAKRIATVDKSERTVVVSITNPVDIFESRMLFSSSSPKTKSKSKSKS